MYVKHCDIHQEPVLIFIKIWPLKCILIRPLYKIHINNSISSPC